MIILGGVRINAVSVCLVLFSGLCVSGCKTGELSSEEVRMVEHRDAVVSDEHKKTVREAYSKARASMLREVAVQADVLWVLRQFAEDDAELMSFADEAKKKVFNPYYVPGVFPDLPRVNLPEYPDRGIGKFIHYLQAAFGGPEERALSWIQDFISSEESGYILTHQLLSLIWAEQAGLPLSDEMWLRRRELWRRVYIEQCSTNGVDSIDLYVERVALVLRYGRYEEIDRRAVRKWIERIIDLQLDDGSWPLSRTRIRFDGASTVVSSPRSHTTVLAMAVFDSYLHNY
ncbi:hypothetical protein EGM51_09575 [Verrucomicrobia bacterium S94]|nr:hypothetical protein EGM51_09575 [Verrucomicrobia bacterium S94]